MKLLIQIPQNKGVVMKKVKAKTWQEIITKEIRCLKLSDRKIIISEFDKLDLKSERAMFRLLSKSLIKLIINK